mmetsp:Transcript_2321/g.6513  ORF Transcript_2321/g.6513 Transcript_2321/m.6513 type:complete len:237 (-) Transcript_2321:4154-4864(-)
MSRSVCEGPRPSRSVKAEGKLAKGNRPEASMWPRNTRSKSLSARSVNFLRSDASSHDLDGGRSLSSNSVASPRHSRGSTSRAKETSCSPSRSANAAATSASSRAPCSRAEADARPEHCGSIRSNSRHRSDSEKPSPYDLRRPSSVTSSRPRAGEQPASDASAAQKTGLATTTDRGMNRESCRCCCARPRTTRSPSFDAVCIISASREWTQSMAWALLNCSRSSLPGVYICTKVCAP